MIKALLRQSLRPRSLTNHRTAKTAPWCIAALIIFGTSLWLLWPVPLGKMPLSADHTVHLTRIWLWKKQLLMGQVRGWDPTWGFGFPIADLYPPLGDALTLLLYALGVGILSMSSCYAFAFTLIFSLQGLIILRLAQVAYRSHNFSPIVPAIVGTLAALLFLWDPGAYREGGWIYTVQYGVWPQALATSLVWLGFAELASEADDSRIVYEREDFFALLRSAFAFGFAILAHPMAIPMLLLAWPVYSLSQIRWQKQYFQSSLIAAFVSFGIALALAIGISSWWLLPMLEHKAWMANYGWLYMPLSNMVSGLLRGEWTHFMFPAIGTLAIFGYLMVATVGNRFSRFVGAISLVYWVFASQDTFWDLRLDRYSDAFTHIQYQRFLIAAKPGIFLMSFFGCGIVVERIQSLRLPPRWQRFLRWLALLAALWVTQQSCSHGLQHKVGQIQIDRIPGKPQFDTDYFELVDWLNRKTDSRDSPLHIAVRAPRNSHWFMDLPALVNLRLYKMGFTPGDNFIHKPESSSPRILTALGIDYIISIRPGNRALAREIARFGDIRVVEREPSSRSQGFRPTLEGIGSATVVSEDLVVGHVRLEIRGLSQSPEPNTSTDQVTTIKLPIAGYPRWELTLDGVPIKWYERPVWGDAAPIDPNERQSGVVHSGKARGNDGSEASLISATILGDGILDVYYRRWKAIDWIGLSLSCFSILTMLGLAWPKSSSIVVASINRVSTRKNHRILMGLIGIAAIVPIFPISQKVTQRIHEESRTALARWSVPSTEPKRRIRPGPIKSEMLIRAALIARPKAKRPAQIVFRDLTLPQTLSGWVALDDDFALSSPSASHRINVSVKDDNNVWKILFSSKILHRPGAVPLNISTGKFAESRRPLKIEIESSSKKRILSGFNLHW